MEIDEITEELPFHQRTGLQAVGIVNGRPVWPVLGGADDGDDDDADDADDGDDDSDDDSGDDGADNNTQGASGDKPSEADRFKATAKRERTARLAAEKKLREATKKNETDTDKANREADERAAAKWKPVAVRNAARAALAEAGAKGDLKRFVKLIDVDTVEVDDDGDVLGLEDQIDAIKADFPEAFGERKAKPGSIDGGRRKPTDSDKKESFQDKIAAMVTG